MQDLMKKAGSAATEQYQKYTEGLEFPATKQEIVSHAKEKGAPDQVVSQLEKLPDKKYDSMGDVGKTAAKSVF